MRLLGRSKAAARTIKVWSEGLLAGVGETRIDGPLMFVFDHAQTELVCNRYQPLTLLVVWTSGIQLVP